MKLLYKILTIFSIAAITLFVTREQNIALAILVSVLVLIDYFIWIRGGNTVCFCDSTKIEKDLRKIQKLKIEKELKELERDNKFN